MSTHDRAMLTTDTEPHAATDTIPCWCGATDAKPRGLNVLSALPWTAGGIAGLLALCRTVDRSTLPKYARNLSGDLEPLPPDPADMSEAELMAAWTAGDAGARVPLLAEMERRDGAGAAADTEAAWATDTAPYVSTHEASRPSVDLDYAGYLHSQYLAAESATHGYMVTPAGTARGYTGSDFFRQGRRPSVEKWGTDELRGWFGSGNAAATDDHGMGHVLSKTEYAAAVVARRPELVAA